MGILHAAILGIIEGITEFLPISSTGHLMLTSSLLGIAQTEFVKSFEVAIQLGAILSVVVIYWKSLLVQWETMKRIAVAFIPTAVIGFALYKVVKSVFLGSTSVVLWSLLVGGILIILFERWHKEKGPPVGGAIDDVSRMTYRQAALIGVFQSLAVVPGVSRAAATIVGGLLLGLSRRTIVEFSFLLAVPTMLAATGYDLLKSAGSFATTDLTALAVGFLVSFAVAFVVVRWFIRFVQTHTFTAFGWYRIAVALAFLIAL
jgi:undecaprenyl-diphosphatase